MHYVFIICRLKLLCETWARIHNVFPLFPPREGRHPAPPPHRELQLGTSPQARAIKRAPDFTVLGRERPERTQSPTSFWRCAGCEVSARVQQHHRCDGCRGEKEEVLGFKLHTLFFFLSFLTGPYRKRLEEARILF